MTFTDDAENEETLTSVATVPVAAAPNREATGAPAISGTSQVNQTLTADTSAIADEDGLADVSYSYQWISGGSDIDGSTGSSYELTSSEQEQTIQVRVTFTDDAGNDETLTSASVGPVQAGESAPGAPIRLASRKSVPGEDEGIVLEWRAPPGTVTGYRILRIEVPMTLAFLRGEPLPHGCTVEFVVHVDDTGSDATTYTDTDVAEGASYEYRVKAINSDGVGPQSPNTALQYRPHVWWPNGTPASPPPAHNVLSTRVNDGVELTWDAPTVPGPEATGYQIHRRHPEQCEFGFPVYVDDTGNSETSWIDTDVEPETLYEYLVRATNDFGAGQFSSSYTTSIRPATLEAGDQPNNPATGAPTIAGTVQVGETLTADTSGIDDGDGLTGARFFYQWLSGEDTEITGATSATYTPVSTDEGKTIKVRVKFTDDALYQEALTSSATAEVAAGSEPTQVEVTPPDDNTAPRSPSLLWSRWSVRGEPDGIVLHWRAPPGPVTGYQILRSEPHGCTTQMVAHVDDTGSDATTYMDTDVAEGVTYIYRVRAINSNGVGGRSGFTNQQYRPHGWWPSGGPGTPLNPRNLEGMQVNDGTELQGIELTWDAPEDFGTEVTGYQILRRLPEQCEYGYRVYVENTNSTDTRWTDRDVEIGTLYEYHVRAINDVGPGFLARSNSASVRPKETVIMIVIGHSRLVNTPGSSDELTIAVNHLKKDDDPDTVDYTLRGDVTLDADGSDADGCEGDGLGEDLEITVVDEAAEQFKATFGGQGCNAGTYTLTFALTDRDGQEVGTFDFEFEVREAVSLPTIGGTAQVGQILTADTTGIDDEDGLTDVSYSYQWVRSDGNTDSDIQDATSSTYTLSDDDVGKTIKVRVSFTDDANNQETLTSAATAEVAATVPTEPLSLTVTRGSQIQELDVSWQAPSSNGGSDVTGYKVQWKESADSWDTEADVSEATVTGTTHTITSLTGGVEYAVRVIATNIAGDGPASTEAAGTPAGGVSEQNTVPENNAPTGLPTISGTPQVDQTLTANTSAIADEDGLTNVSYRYQWIADGTDIDGATASTYTLTYSEQGQTIQVRVTFTDDADNEETLTSVATVAVAAAANRDATGAPTISGTPQVKQTLTADTSPIADEDGLTNTTFEYQWIAGGSDIAGATGSSYELTGSEQGQTIQVRVTFADDRNNEETLTSAATTAVAAKPNTAPTGLPTISGTPQVDQTLTADTSGISDADGLTNVSYEYQWLAGGSEISGATGSSYLLTSSEQGQTIQVRVTFADDADNQETLTSAATTAVAAKPNTAPTGLPTISGTPQVEQTLTADTSAIDDADGLTNVSYEYQWLAGGLEISGATGSSYLLTSSEQGQTIQVRVTFADDADNQETLTSAATVEVAAAADPLTVRLKVAAPATHDGSSEFTFEIEFSEEFGLSYVTLKNHAFNVTGGSVERAQRTDKPSNIPWRITVKPQGTGDVTIELPATTDCGAQGAICTGDSRKLSNSLNFTVSGPGQ